MQATWRVKNSTSLTKKNVLYVYCAAQQGNVLSLLERLGVIRSENISNATAQKVKRRIYLSVMIYGTGETVYKWG